MEIEINQDLTGEDYRALLQDLWPFTKRFSLTVRTEDRWSPPVIETLAALQHSLDSCVETDEWPGTRLLMGAKADVYSFRATSEGLRLLLAAGRSLFGWIAPQAPEDLALYRADGSVILLTVSHERWGRVKLSAEEAANVRGAWMAHVGNETD